MGRFVMPKCEEKNMIRMYLGNCIDIMLDMHAAGDKFDAVIADPPYASGGMSMSERTRTTGEKYIHAKGAEYVAHSFEFDSMDQHAWMAFTTDWLRRARRITRQGGVVAVFCDWRQLPALSDAMQMAGWIWRGTAVWDKVNGRPQRGRIRQQAEFIVWGSNGRLALDRDAPILPGVFSVTQVSTNKRVHQTEKPVVLMRQLVRLCERGGRILDPFMGSGTTLRAAALEGFDADGIELDTYYFRKARERMQAAE